MATASRQPHVLIVDDEEDTVELTRYALRASGINNVVTCTDSRRVPKLISGRRFAAITLDLSMPHLSGIELLAIIVEQSPGTPVIIVTGDDDVANAVECMKRGAYDFLLKPVENARLQAAVRNALDHYSMQNENRSLKERLLSGTLDRPPAFSDIIARSRTMESIFQYAEIIAPTDLPVLLTGETGVGKELLARGIHAASGRTGAFVAVNLAGLDDSMFSDTLFGHARGAFTGAAQDRQGMLVRASEGTIFLDEIGDASVESQTKLLRLLQEREFYRLGDDSPRFTDARFVFATNRNLEQMISSGGFRADLYYRLVSHRIQIPPLRDRAEDIPPLVDHFVALASRKLGRSVPTVTPDFLASFASLPLTGNIRELEGMIFDAVLRARGEQLSVKAVTVGGSRSDSSAPDVPAVDGDLYRNLAILPSLKVSENLLINEALRRSDGNQGKAARLLGLSRTALNKRINRPPA